MFLSLNRRKHEMCETVSKCLRKLAHFMVAGLMIKTKPYVRFIFFVNVSEI